MSVILAYHRVAEIDTDPFSLAVTPTHFEEQLQVLAELMVPISLGRLLQDLDDRRLPDEAVVLTFDDGYADNLEIAEPLLSRHAVPATVFVATGMVGSARELWWDALERVFLGCPNLPDVLRLDIGGLPLRWVMGEAARYTDEQRKADSGNPLLSGEPLGPRRDVFLQIWRLLRPLDSAAQEVVIDQLLQWAGVSSPARGSHRVLSGSELVALAGAELIDIGSHTSTHPLLSGLPGSRQSQEVTASKAWLEEVVGGPVAHFAYPYGGPRSYTADTVAAVRDAGYACACTTVAGTLQTDSDVLQLPRLTPGDWDGARFEAWLQASAMAGKDHGPLDR